MQLQLTRRRCCRRSRCRAVAGAAAALSPSRCRRRRRAIIAARQRGKGQGQWKHEYRIETGRLLLRLPHGSRGRCVGGARPTTPRRAATFSNVPGAGCRRGEPPRLTTSRILQPALAKKPPDAMTLAPLELVLRNFKNFNAAHARRALAYWRTWSGRKDFLGHGRPCPRRSSHHPARPSAPAGARPVGPGANLEESLFRLVAFDPLPLLPEYRT